MLAKRSNMPLTKGPKGTKFSGTKTGADFYKPPAGSHSGCMDGTKYKDVGKGNK